jgi:hypothetical protein
MRIIQTGEIYFSTRSINNRRFFVTPLSDVITRSSNCHQSHFDRQTYRLNFRVEIWNDRVARRALRALVEAKVVNRDSAPDILPLPMRNVRVTKSQNNR